MSVGDVFRMVIVGLDGAGSELVNTLDIAQSAGAGTITAPTLSGFINDFASFFLPLFLPCIGIDYTIARLLCNGISAGVSLLSGESFSDAGTPGSGSGLGDNVERCFLLRKNTGVGGRHGHGRMFLPMPPVGNYFSDGAYDVFGSDNAAFAALAAGLPQPIAITSPVVTFFPVLVNRATSAFLPLTNCAPAPRCGVQRRRRIGIGV